MSAYDVIVLGGGPAGMQAAITAREHGLRVAVVDEGGRPGGQIYRAPSDPVRPADLAANADLARGERLRAALDASGADVLTRHRAWAAAPGMRVDCIAPGGPVSLGAAALVLATGTTERVIPMPGVTLPGVIGLAAATILLKAHGVTPGGPTVVAGVGPLLYAVAAGIRKAGGEVAAIVDLLHPADWAAALPGLASRPDLLARGVRWVAGLRAAGVPVHHRATVTAIHGEAFVQAVEIAPVAADWSAAPGAPRRAIPAASVVIGHGLVPATEFARLLGVPHRYVAAQGGWVPDRAPDGRAADGVYIAGRLRRHFRRRGGGVCRRAGRARRRAGSRRAEAGALRRTVRPGAPGAGPGGALRVGHQPADGAAPRARAQHRARHDRVPLRGHPARRHR
ncbi:MAG: FAD-dependent oxidoreductase [Acetobacteraceae bacterium]